MKELVELNGIVLSANPSEDYDKRLVVLTGERGRITVFARGVRRPNSQFGAAANPFCLGKWELFEGKSAYNLTKVEVKNYFRELTEDVEACYFGFYFLELCDFLCVENVEAKDTVNLLYLALVKLMDERIPNILVRRIFELKMLQLSGTYASAGHIRNDLPSTHETVIYTVEYINSNPIKNIFSFSLEEEYIKGLGKVADYYLEKFVGHKFKSLEILNSLTVE